MADELGAAVLARQEAFRKSDTVARIWRRDHTVWKPDPTELANRLGWLDIAARMQAQLADLASFGAGLRRDGFTHAVLMGMGGSSLGPEVMRESLGVAPGGLQLTVLDSTDPRQVAAVERAHEPHKTLFIVSSKSGGTIETASQLEYFWSLSMDGSRFVAVTDAGSGLHRLAEDRKFRRVFLNDPDIGGRYSVLSFFGLVPGAALGADLAALLADANRMAALCAESDPAANPGAELGIWLAEAALLGREKCTLVLPAEFASFGWWVEQLVAESTGKEGTGILPIEGETFGAPDSYGHDRAFVVYGQPEKAAALEAAGHWVFRIESLGLGAEFFRWEFATAVAGVVLGVQPFDQPNVQEAKDAAGLVLGGKVPEVSPMTIEAALASIEPGDYVAILAFVPREAATGARLAAIREAIRRKYRVAVSVGFGPRYLHSTGQYHKGGPANGVFIQVIDPAVEDLEIPDREYTFGELEAAQALGDMAALLGRGRRAARVSLTALESAVGV